MIAAAEGTLGCAWSWSRERSKYKKVSIFIFIFFSVQSSVGPKVPFDSDLRVPRGLEVKMAQPDHTKLTKNGLPLSTL